VERTAPRIFAARYGLACCGVAETVRVLAPDQSLDLARLRAGYRARTFRPSEVVESVLERIARRGNDKVWIHKVPHAALIEHARRLEGDSPDRLPLYGVPFAIKDNIDLAGHPTTAACPEFAYTPRASAPAVQRLVDAGAIPIGKTNLDQFATGLVGTRSPYGACRNPFDPEYLAGGSSSGSAVAVSVGLVSFALGTDTAGSGRVPAAFNNIVGLKPTRGLLSTRGVVPACRSLDVVSIFTLTVADALDVLAVAQGFDAADPFSREATVRSAPDLEQFNYGVPAARDLEFFGDKEAARLFAAFLKRLEELGGTEVEIDFRPFLETARLLYEGPWLAERYWAVRELVERHPEALHPVTREVIARGAKVTAVDAFDAYYRLKALQRATAAVWKEIDFLALPTAGTIYRIAEVEADPIRLNSNLGHYTNFVNLLDLSGLAVPAGFRADGLPFGATLLARACEEDALGALGMRIQHTLALPLGATGIAPPETQSRAAGSARAGMVRLAVCGAHMAGLPLNRELVERGARFLREARTAPRYRFFALESFSPPRPGLVRAEPGNAVPLEVWEVPAAELGAFVDGIPAPLAIGTLELEDGEPVHGFLCEHYATADARDISELGGWRAYLAARG
jgi:allophanate hydrolase